MSAHGFAVAMFSGGRGGAAIARELLRVPGTALSLVINGYDNGLSTGALRRYLPGMLGPSDFRKNLSLHLDAADPRTALLRYRFPPGATRATFDEVAGRYDGTAAEPDLAAFRRHLHRHPHGLDLTDCSLGNLLLAGAYLRLGRDFNGAVATAAQALGSPVRLLNVTNGENAFLAARKADGRLIADEADLVAPQDASPVTDLFLLREPLSAGRQAELERRPAHVVRRVLTGESATVTLSPEARQALHAADVVVYGPGTPHSSLLPSYLTPGVADAIAGGRARARVFVVNTRADHDVRGLSAEDLVDRTLTYLGDPRNERQLVTHVLQHATTDHRPARTWAGVTWITADLESRKRPGVHSGRRTVGALTRIAGSDTLVPL
jgi:2-phospho-L-lactate transferase/gluconeogenesis factor (CofD/UPF0052 family)